ncbi:DNA repair protein rad52 [Exophiala xenobiotica]|uniref:RAD52 homolog n=1 Tax=Vermiconidia calcicola TaxID=1690605 RepID=A0AAV9Q5C8_9PEZI|nr:DNA repair protein rad52 [Exophiala xenobiotica]KAK5535142.1 DNA repair protein rad52 [Vermiconidia calcicola]KAK5535601.1 DNA repair protein rad52 [Chaetothyriales sp. CCFEE 6169]KAK5209352.1 DNA repair protein rad52 [Exophiala xenobiotica]KAK5223864.1 DNA repair protein rad52 [Exophiala xenobiotica]
MPAVGDQHKPSGSTTANPFEEPKQRISEYTAQEIATLQNRLDKQLGPEYISNRPGPGGQKVHYLSADKLINLANEVFGFNGWSSSIQNIQIDFVDENPQTGKISLGLSVIVRVTLKDGTHHEDIGYGQVENAKGKAAAFEKAKKEGTTDALKRAMRNFGNLLGNCVYDKSYLAKVSKLKVPATKWDADNLHRHPDFAPKKQEDEGKRNPSGLSRAASASASTDIDDTFDFPDFEVEDFDAIDMAQQDEVALPSEPADTTRRPGNGGPEGMPPPTRADMTTPSKPPAPVPRPVVTKSATGSSTNIVPQPLPGQRPHAMQAQPVRPVAGSDPRGVMEQTPRPSSPNVASDHFAQQPGGQAAPGQPFRAGFYSAKAAGVIDANNNVIPTAAAAAPKFNPHAESPSIRKTSGVDHKKSAPLKRDLKPDTTLPTNVINPQVDQTRRVGAPGPNVQFASIRGPSTSAYRPPTRRGPEPAATSTTNQPEQGADRVSEAAKRTPLGDMSNMQHSVTGATVNGPDAKRQKIVDSGQDSVNGMPSEHKTGA